jgi:hypothetical protein
MQLLPNDVLGFGPPTLPRAALVAFKLLDLGTVVGFELGFQQFEF